MATRTRAIVGALLALALSSQLRAATALNILFIGNSITYYNTGLDVVCARSTGAANIQICVWALRICRRQATGRAAACNKALHMTETCLADAMQPTG